MRHILLFFISVLFLACNQQSSTDQSISQKPEHLLSQEVFTNMFYDAQLTEAAVRNEIVKGTDSKDISRYLYNQLFDKYGISEADFKANIKYYASDPEVMQEIQTEIVNRLSLKETELANSKEKTDSINQ